MNGRWLFFLVVLGAGALAPAQTPSLDAFQSLKPGDIAAEQAAVTHLLLQTNDPAILLGAARIVQAKYIDPLVNTLEYWGPDAPTQEQLRPSADALLRLIDSGAINAKRLADRAAEAMRNADDAATLQQWKDSTAQVTAAQRQKVNAEYARLLAAEPEEKKTWEDRALFSAGATPRSAALPAAVDRLQIAKILLAGGQSTEAKRDLAKLMSDSGDDIAAQFQEHYFFSVCDLMAGDLAQADADLSELKNWQRRTMAGPNAIFANSAGAAAAILEYRIDLARADQGSGPDQKISFETAAIQAMQNFIRAQPALKATVLQHLGDRFAGRVDHSHAEPLLLEAIMQSGAAADADARTLAAAQWAAQTVLQRSETFDPATVDFAAALSAAIFDRNGQTRAAAEAYFALATRLENRNPQTAAAALDRAIELFRQMPDRTADTVYTQALAMAMQKPFDRKNLGYAYGQTLVDQKKYRAALAVFQQITPDDTHYQDAELAQMVCVERLLDGESAPARLASAGQLANLEKDILRRSAGPSANAVSATLICAEVDQTLHEPEMTLEQLRDLPARARGLAHERELLQRADELRVAALVQLDRPTEAVDALAADPARIELPVTALIKELDTAETTSNPPGRLKIVQARVCLGDWLVKHARSQNADEMNRYRFFYADSLRREGELVRDEPTQQGDLHKALEIFQQLAAENSGEASDPAPLLGQAGVQFDLGNYTAVHEILFPLLNAGRFGDGQGPAADAYWEATYELLASNAALADSGSASPQERADNVAYLKRLCIQWGDQIGGKRWHTSFEILRRRLAHRVYALVPYPAGVAVKLLWFGRIKPIIIQCNGVPGDRPDAALRKELFVI